MAGLIFFLGILIFILVVSGLRIVQQYEKALVMTLGKYTGQKSPGLNLIIPFGIQKLVKLDMRIITIDVPKQEVITKDNVTINIDAVVFIQVRHAEKAYLEVQNYRLATAQFAQSALRDVVGQVELDTLLSQRERVSGEIKQIVDKATEPWGIDVPDIKIQNVELPQDMKRVIAKQAEAEREKRAVITKALGELESSENLATAAKRLAAAPGALHLRTLTTLNDLSSDQSNTVIFAIPLEVLRAFEGMADSSSFASMANSVISKHKPTTPKPPAAKHQTPPASKT